MQLGFTDAAKDVDLRGELRRADAQVRLLPLLLRRRALRAARPRAPAGGRASSQALLLARVDTDPELLPPPLPTPRNSAPPAPPPFSPARNPRSIPKGFDEELRFLSRELLRAWPEAAAGGAAEDSTAWTMRFAEDYFANGGREGLLARRRAESAVAGDDEAEEEEIPFPTPEELEAKIQQIFVAADTDGNGVLDRKEFKRVMKLFASELKLQVSDLRQIMLLADENDDGLIEYHEFVPVALELLQTMYAKMRHAQQQAKRQSRAADAAQDFLLNGLTREQLEAALGEMFRAADTDGSGELDRKEFQTCLKSSDLGLTKKQIALLMDEVDSNYDGVVQYSEFVPIAFGLLSEMVSKQMEYDQLPADEAAAMDYLQGLFAEYDADGSGRLHISTLKQAFSDGDIGLSKLQLRALLAEAKVDAKGEVDYKEFAKTSAGMIASILSVMTDSDRAARVVAARAGSSSFTIMGLSRDAFPEAMRGAFAAIDPEGSGRAPMDALAELLRTSLGLDDRTVNTICNVAWEGGLDEAGNVDLNFVAAVSFDVLAQMESMAAY